MQRRTRVGIGLAILAFCVVVALLAPGLFQTQKGWDAHGFCFAYNPTLMWLLVSSNSLIWLAYLGIGLALALFIIRISAQINYWWMFLCFATFIVACGWSHFFDIVVLWVPIYMAQAAMLILTAIVSVGTWVLLIIIEPRAEALVRDARASSDLRKQVVELERQLAAERGTQPGMAL